MLEQQAGHLEPLGLGRDEQRGLPMSVPAVWIPAGFEQLLHQRDLVAVRRTAHTLASHHLVGALGRCCLLLGGGGTCYTQYNMWFLGSSSCTADIVRLNAMIDECDYPGGVLECESTKLTDTDGDHSMTQYFPELACRTPGWATEVLEWWTAEQTADVEVEEQFEVEEVEEVELGEGPAEAETGSALGSGSSAGLDAIVGEREPLPPIGVGSPLPRTITVSPENVSASDDTDSENVNDDIRFCL